MAAGPERYPFIPLRKALDRAKQLWDKAGDHPVVTTDAFAVWGYSPKASGGSQTVAALKYYGIVQDIGANEARKIRLTEETRRYFLDERPEKHAEAHRYFALKPKALAALWAHWKAKPPSEPIARSTLKLDFGYSENAANELLAIYSDNLLFADLAASDSVSSRSAGEADEDAEWDQAQPSGGGSAPRMEAAMQEPQQAHMAQRPGAHVAAAGSRADICNIPEGEVVLSFPERFSQASLKDIEAWLDFQKARLARWATEH
ncbi:hypothetical protein [Methylobacterium sp. yr668]|uniref:hypothetical protein n=1 Tax=Methylobacterium sp. yr668 TaxID=1761801 RepID=UPI0008E43256|nr:hypothetical protein [Methylobacterium sp. yr668]SFT11974.1 hypothetical protein SAMN04487845_11757 [Methylobacterium sp. yr668]